MGRAARAVMHAVMPVLPLGTALYVRFLDWPHPFHPSTESDDMVKKFKAMAREAGSDGQLAAAIKDSAQQIWLAGLGAFSKAQEEGQKVFEALVKEGNSLHKRTMKTTEDKVTDVTSKLGRVAGEFSKQANGTWDKLETVFEQRVERALSRLGVPSNKEIGTLTKRVEELTAHVNKLTRGRPAAKRARKSAKSARSGKAA
jgi:poly(hydroxyalkanoate) granule-associated protein